MATCKCCHHAGLALVQTARNCQLKIQHYVFVFYLGMISLTPPYGSMLGGTGVVVTGDDLVVNQRDAIVCLFDGIEVRGIYINSQKVLCVSPLLERTGKLQFMLNISGSNRGESVFTSCKSASQVEVTYGQMIIRGLHAAICIKYALFSRQK